MSPALKSAIQFLLIVNMAALIMIGGLLLGYQLNVILVTLVAILLYILVRDAVNSRKKS